MLMLTLTATSGFAGWISRAEIRYVDNLLDSSSGGNLSVSASRFIPGYFSLVQGPYPWMPPGRVNPVYTVRHDWLSRCPNPGEAHVKYVKLVPVQVGLTLHRQHQPAKLPPDDHLGFCLFLSSSPTTAGSNDV